MIGLKKKKVSAAQRFQSLDLLATLVAVFGMNPPESLYLKEGFWVVLGSGLMLGFLVRSIVSWNNRKKPE